MKQIKMTFGDFEFPVNPKKIKISASSNTDEVPAVDTGVKSRRISQNPLIITGHGELYGGSAQEYCGEFLKLIKSPSPDWLFVPMSAPIFALFTEFSFSSDAVKNSIVYDFKFVQAEDKKDVRCNFGYTYVLAGENAFDVAHRCGVSVNRIMELNDFVTPFDLNEGDKAVFS